MTFEEWQTDNYPAASPEFISAASESWHARDAEVADLQARIKMLAESESLELVRMRCELAASRELGPYTKEFEEWWIEQAKSETSDDLDDLDLHQQAVLAGWVKKAWNAAIAVARTGQAEVRQAAEQAAYKDTNAIIDDVSTRFMPDFGTLILTAKCEIEEKYKNSDALSRVVAKAVRAEAEWWHKRHSLHSGVGIPSECGCDDCQRLAALEADRSQPGAEYGRSKSMDKRLKVQGKPGAELCPDLEKVDTSKSKLLPYKGPRK